MSSPRNVYGPWSVLFPVAKSTYDLLFESYSEAAMAAGTTQTPATIAATAAAPQEKKESEKKWGKAVLSHGYCIFPSILLQAQARLGVNAQEMMVLLQLTEHWYKAAGQVFPSKGGIAQRIGLSTKQVQRHIRRLEELKLVQRKERYRSGGSRTTNLYDLSGLVAKLKAIEPDFRAAKKLKAAAAGAGGLTAGLAAHQATMTDHT